MKNPLYKLSIVIITIIIGISFYSCEKEKIYPPNDEIAKEFHDFMEYWYLWNDSIPDVDPDDFSDPYDLLEAMRYELRDRWSYITTQDAFKQYYEEGTYVGYGFGYSPDSDGNMRITFLFDDSDMVDDGVTRGWIIREINGVSINEDSDLSELLGANEIGVSNEFVLESPEGDIINESFAKKLVYMNTVLNRTIIDAGSKKAGYLVFKSFIQPSIDELNEAFNYFNAENIDELIIDLRYNGGGQMDVAMYLVGLFITDDLNDQLFLKYIHNSNRTSDNYSYKLAQESNSVRLNKVYFITSKSSASASEAIINGIDPYMDVYLVGDDTYGKPVGMYSFFSKISDLAYVPITFKILNANNEGEYYNGLPVNSYADDDVTRNFGDSEESSLQEVIYHIENGSFSGKKSAIDVKRKTWIKYHSLQDEIGAL